jgi:methylenetetrahydrofolate reductase (NADPH)
MNRPLIEGFSLEMTGADVPGLHEAHALLPPGTRVNVTFLGSEDLALRIAAARAIKDHGLVPVPHIAARRLFSEQELRDYLEALREIVAVENLFVVGGDPRTPHGPYTEALDVIESGLPALYGARQISISGYPEKHPDIPKDALDAALDAKSKEIVTAGLDGSIIMQFAFDVDPVLRWIEDTRDRGIALPIRVGIPGPAGIKQLLSFARRFGVASSSGVARKYGFSLTNLLGTAGPDKFIRELEERLEPERHGEVRLHFYTFGGLHQTAEWIRDFAGGR